MKNKPEPTRNQPARARDRLSGVELAALGFFALCAVYATAVHFAVPVVPEDDAFIIYRYVDNAVAGKGWVYNPGQRVFGVSTPLYLAFLTALKSAARAVPTPDLAVRVNFLFCLAAGVGLLFLLRRVLGRTAPAALLAGLFLLRDDMLRASTGGMESFLFTALLLWCLWALADKRIVLAGLLAGLSILARPEGVVAIAATGAVWLATGRRRTLPFLSGLLLPGIAWLVFGFAVYGTPVYHSLIAKSRPLYPLPFGYGFFRALRELEFRVLGNLAVGGAPTRLPFSLLTVVALALFGIAAWGSLARGRGREDGLLKRPGTGLVLLVFLAFLLFYLATNPLMFAWYYPPLFVLFSVVVWLGIARLGEQRPRLKTPALVLALLLGALWGLRQPVVRIAGGSGLLDIGVASDPVRVRIDGYRAAAEWLNDVVPDGLTLAAPEVGSLGYYYKGPVIDACGLVSPEALPYQPAPASERVDPRDGVIPTGLVRDLAPPIVVSMATFARLSIYRDRWFRDNYSLVRQFPLSRPLWGSTSVDVLIRRGLVVVEPATAGAGN